jgi:ribosomal protein L34E
VERERLLRMRAVLREAERGHHSNPRCEHCDSTILLVALWAALHGKPISWATVPAHWPADLRPRGGLPSQSCMSRRLRGI